MSDDIWARAEIASPCIKICTIHPEAKICVGCYRTGAEIAAWGRMSAQVRDAVMAELPGRAPQLAKRRGGRSGRITHSDG
ncbi:MAG: DUF1289 domain-containing protein [Pseudomonadota bacterium]